MKKLLKNLKKGFTIVELVIVIAVIAILAGVLIPTFSGVVESANKSAALQTARSALTNGLSMSTSASLAKSDSNGYHTVFVVDGYAFGYEGNQLVSIDYPGASKSSISTLTSGAKYDSSKSAFDKSFNTIIVSYSYLTDDLYTDSEAVDTNGKLTGALKADTELSAADAKAYNAKLTGALSTAKLTADEAAAYNTAMSPETDKAANDELTDAEAAAYNATLTGAKAEDGTLTAAEAKAYNATLTGAVKEGDHQKYYLSVAISNVIASASEFASIDENKSEGYTVTADKDGNYTVTDGTYSATLYVHSDLTKDLVIFTAFNA